MNGNEIKGILGLCVRAGQAVFGEESCRKSISAGQCGAVLLDNGASQNTQKRYEELCRFSEVPLIMLPENLLGEATGKPGVAMAVRKGTLAERVIRCYSDSDDDMTTKTTKMYDAEKAGGTNVEWRK